MNGLDFAARRPFRRPALTISQDSVASFRYTLRDAAGAIIDQSDAEPLAYWHGHGQLVLTQRFAEDRRCRAAEVSGALILSERAPANSGLDRAMTRTV